jgi:hypothetical protein
MNVQSCQNLSFRIRGQEGREAVHLYLDDGSFRWGADISQFAPVTKTWQPVSVPLSEFSRYGVDLTHVSSLQFVFEWKPISGTVYVDDLSLVCGEANTEKNANRNVPMSRPPLATLGRDN